MKPPFGLFTSSSFSLLPHAPLRSDLRQPRREIDYCNYDYDLASSEKIPPLYPVAVFSHLPTYVSASYPLPKTLAFRATEVICKVDRNTAPTYLAYYPKAAHWSFIDKTLNHPRVRAQALASSKPSDDDDVELLLRRLFFFARLYSTRHQKQRGRERRTRTRASSSSSAPLNTSPLPLPRPLPTEVPT